MYNVQSGIPRGAFPKSLEPSMKAGTLKMKQAMPGNVFHEMKSFMAEGEGVAKRLAERALAQRQRDHDQGRVDRRDQKTDDHGRDRIPRVDP